MAFIKSWEQTTLTTLSVLACQSQGCCGKKYQFDTLDQITAASYKHW